MFDRALARCHRLTAAKKRIFKPKRIQYLPVTPSASLARSLFHESPRRRMTSSAAKTRPRTNQRRAVEFPNSALVSGCQSGNKITDNC